MRFFYKCMDFEMVWPKMQLTFDEYTVSSRRNLLSPDLISSNPQSILMSQVYA